MPKFDTVYDKRPVLVTMSRRQAADLRQHFVEECNALKYNRECRTHACLVRAGYDRLNNPDVVATCAAREVCKLLKEVVDG